MSEYDIAIIGAGSAGLSAADFAVKLGAQVALIEKDRVGGDCTWTGCVPSKTLLKTAKVAHDMRSAASYVLPSLDRAMVSGNTDGFIRLVHKSNGTLLGVTIVASRAGEMIHEWILALDSGLKVDDITRAIHIYPTYSIAGMQAAAEIRVEKLMSGTSGKILRVISRIMG
jgi:pyruvate/2-oxoglutarate dehydrogenase complex dihydrolipoamide dehydrogenase (E3) component